MTPARMVRVGIAGVALTLAQSVSVVWALPPAPMGMAPTQNAPEPTLRPTSLEQAKRETVAWLRTKQLDDAKLRTIEPLWSTDGASLDLVERLVRTAALGEPQLAALVDYCALAHAGRKLPDVTWLDSESLPALLRHNARLFFGRWLAQERLYDEAAEQLKHLNPDMVVDPSVLLFYQSVVHHRLLDKEAGLRAVDRLLQDVADVPQRFRAVAALMKVDLQQLDDKTLDHIARRMEDIRRRLDLGRAGEKVVKVEDGVIESLDKLIEEMEKQQQQSQGGGGSSGAMRPNAPMQQSQAAGGKGAGETDKKRVGNTAGWGDLPPKQREEAMQQIGKDFPAHYRDVIEQYFRKLASEPEKR